MLDFSETSRRIAQNSCDCSNCRDTRISHEDIAMPLVQQLAMAEIDSPNGRLFTYAECSQLALFIRRQAAILDSQQQAIDAYAPLTERMAIARKWATRGLVVGGLLLLWVAATTALVHFVKGV